MFELEKNSIPKSYLISLLGLLIASSVTNYDQLNAIGLYIIIPFSFIVTFLADEKDLSLNYSHKILLIVYMWIFCCIPFAFDIDAASRMFSKVAGCILLTFTISRLCKNEFARVLLLLIPLIYLASAWYYAYTNLFGVISFGDERLNEEGGLNANVFGYYTFYSIFSVYLLGEFLDGWPARICKLLLFLAGPLVFYTAMYTCSRQVLLISMPFWIILLMFRYARFSIKSFLFTILIVIVTVLLYNNYGSAIYEDSLLQERIEHNISDDERAGIVEDCLELGYANPLHGVGPLNAKLFTRSHLMAHNSFLELFADTGFLGMFLFVCFVLSFLAIQTIRYYLSRDKIFLTLIIFGLFWLVYQFFYVFYDNLWLIMYFILISLISDYYYDRLEY